jgi:hypothetical protein
LDWVSIGNLGQAYGAVSAIATSLALVGIAATTWLQVKQSQLSAAQAARTQQFQIFNRAWDDPLLLESIVNIKDVTERQMIRQLTFINQYIMYLRMGAKSGEISYAEVTTIAAEAFSTPSGREYWKRTRFHFHNFFIDTKSDRQFVKALDAGFAQSQNDERLAFADTSPSKDTAGHRAYWVGATALTLALTAIWRRLKRDK